MSLHHPEVLKAGGGGIPLLLVLSGGLSGLPDGDEGPPSLSLHTVHCR